MLRKYAQYSDVDLVSKYQATKDLYYLGLLFERYNEMTVSLALSYLKNEHDAEDAVMECFELMHKELATAQIKNFGGWYYTMVRNQLLKIKRKRGSHQAVELVEGLHDHGDADLFHMLFDTKESRMTEIVEEVLDKLKPIQEKCVKAFYMEGKSYKEISDQYSMTEKEVKSHLQNGKRKIKIELEKKNVKSVNEIS
ncbi:RNA polymerase sigma factor [Brumimicrobium salinarum]|uniref:RNA polymerase sigma factor n=1 Tax=Brumimicrobium salinarum TaxID=2058658 RepID=UPI0010544405|nr:sigma-70 family RNA polymerase sigma factor [Brumimicrobium salinarum]